MVRIGNSYELKPVAHIETDFSTKFGVPRQSGLVKGLKGRIIFEPEYRDPEALRGLEGFSHIWLLWDFSEARTLNSKLTNSKFKFKATVRPPRLGGNRRMGVWATRSPFRPNNIGLSSVRIESIELHTPEGPVITVEGADLMDGTPIFDIKPYLPFTDSHPEATGGFAEETFNSELSTDAKHYTFNPYLYPDVSLDSPELHLFPRPHYHDDPDRVYGLPFAGEEVKFRIKNNEVEAWLV